jgi:DNA-binding transcriptional regulator YiaG
MEEAFALKRVYRLQKVGRLPELRESVGLSQSDVARALDVSQSAVSRWERLHRPVRPRGPHAVALLELLEAE